MSKTLTFSEKFKIPFFVNTFQFFNWGTYYLKEDNIDEFLKIINVNKDTISYSDINSLINNLLITDSIIHINFNKNKGDNYLNLLQLNTFFDSVNKLLNKQNINITISLEDIENNIKQNDDLYKRYLKAKNSSLKNLMFSLNSIIYICNDILQKNGYALYELNIENNIYSQNKELYFIGKMSDLSMNPNSPGYR